MNEAETGAEHIAPALGGQAGVTKPSRGSRSIFTSKRLQHERSDKRV